MVRRDDELSDLNRVYDVGKGVTRLELRRKTGLRVRRRAKCCKGTKLRLLREERLSSGTDKDSGGPLSWLKLDGRGNKSERAGRDGLEVGSTGAPHKNEMNRRIVAEILTGTRCEQP